MGALKANTPSTGSSSINRQPQATTLLELAGAEPPSAGFSSSIAKDDSIYVL